jgi:hypothetical protein
MCTKILADVHVISLDVGGTAFQATHGGTAILPTQSNLNLLSHGKCRSLTTTGAKLEKMGWLGRAG